MDIAINCALRDQEMKHACINDISFQARGTVSCYQSTRRYKPSILVRQTSNINDDDNINVDTVIMQRIFPSIHNACKFD